MSTTDTKAEYKSGAETPQRPGTGDGYGSEASAAQVSIDTQIGMPIGEQIEMLRRVSSELTFLNDRIAYLEPKAKAYDVLATAVMVGSRLDLGGASGAPQLARQTRDKADELAKKRDYQRKLQIERVEHEHLERYKARQEQTEREMLGRKKLQDRAVKRAATIAAKKAALAADGVAEAPKVKRTRTKRLPAGQLGD